MYFYSRELEIVTPRGNNTNLRSVSFIKDCKVNVLIYFAFGNKTSLASNCNSMEIEMSGSSIL
jgi:hypothetical protein